VLTLPGFGAHNAQPNQHSGSVSLRHTPRTPLMHRPLILSIFIHFGYFRHPLPQLPRVAHTPHDAAQPLSHLTTYKARDFTMVVVDEKTMLPPPPSDSRALPLTRTNVAPVPEYLHPPPFSAPFRRLATLPDLPSHLLLHIVHRTFPQAPDLSYNKLERQRKTLRWLTTSLRLVNRTFYIGAQFRSCVFPPMSET
jgi:hypothetical protein